MHKWSFTSQLEDLVFRFDNGQEKDYDYILEQTKNPRNDCNPHTLRFRGYLLPWKPADSKTFHRAEDSKLVGKVYGFPTELMLSEKPSKSPGRGRSGSPKDALKALENGRWHCLLLGNVPTGELHQFLLVVKRNGDVVNRVGMMILNGCPDILEVQGMRGITREEFYLA
jgi:hypothetical protein